MRAEQPAVGFISLGCPKALVDSERNQRSEDGQQQGNEQR